MGLYQYVLGAGAFFLTVASLSGCGGGSALGETATLSGRIENWSLGPQTLEAGFYGGTPFATSPIDAGGNFSIALPGGSVVMRSILIEMVGPNKPVNTGCTGTQQWAPELYGAAQLIMITRPAGASRGILQLSAQDKESYSRVEYLYVDREWNHTAEIDCKNSRGGADHQSIDLHFKPGWNRQITTTSQLGNATTSKSYTGADPGGIPWTLF